ncbi:MAG: hypothetical protein QG577_1741 [Thermodesulfobacteriota bacterium]|nr:hypothetical protein [Thermodesulfobacteriota bacterium]
MLSLIIMAPPSIRAESAVRLYDKSMKLFNQIRDLDLMQRNIEECYQAEKRTLVGTCSSGQYRRDHTEFDGELMNRVLGHLADTQEYEEFMMAYQDLIQRPGYRSLHTDELFAAYMRLLKSGRLRFLAQLEDRQESVPENCSIQAHEGLAQSVPVKPVMFGRAEGTQKAESERLVPAVLFHVQMPLNGSKPIAVSGKSVSIIVVPHTDQSGNAAPTIDVVELHVLIAQERVVP